MSLYGDFIKERENIEIIENEMGFITYSCNSGSYCVHNLYVMPAFRGSQVGYDLYLQVELKAKGQGHTKIYTTVAPSTQGSSETLRRLLNHGWTLQGCVQGLIYLYRPIL